MIDSLLGKGLPANIQKLLKTSETQNTTHTEGLGDSQAALADQITLSKETSQALETLKNLDQQLTRFLDVLKGKRDAGEVIKELDAENNGFVAGIEKRTALSVSQVQSIQETTALTSEINDEGELDLLLTQTREQISQTSFTLSSSHKAFMAKFSS